MWSPVLQPSEVLAPFPQSTHLVSPYQHSWQFPWACVWWHPGLVDSSETERNKQKNLVRPQCYFQGSSYAPTLVFEFLLIFFCLLWAFLFMKLSSLVQWQILESRTQGISISVFLDQLSLGHRGVTCSESNYLLTLEVHLIFLSLKLPGKLPFWLRKWLIWSLSWSSSQREATTKTALMKLPSTVNQQWENHCRTAATTIRPCA